MTVPAELDRRFREAAVRSGLLDAGYDIVDSPVGALLVAATDRGILRISFDPVPEQEIEHLARLAGPRVLRAPARLDPLRRELDEYFEGRRRAFDLSLDLRGTTPFTSGCSASSPSSRSDRLRPMPSSRLAPAIRRRRGRSGW